MPSGWLFPSPRGGWEGAITLHASHFTLHVFLLPSGRLGGGFPFLHCFDFQCAVVGDFENFHALAGWDRVAECESVYFMDRATDADLDFSLAFVVSWDAEIDVCHLSLALLNIESSVRLQLVSLFLHPEEEKDENDAYDHSNDCEEEIVADGVAEADAAPSETNEEVDEVANGEERQAAAEVHGVAVNAAEVGHVEIDIHVS